MNSVFSDVIGLVEELNTDANLGDLSSFPSTISHDKTTEVFVI